jgi:hypothetical protein
VKRVALLATLMLVGASSAGAAADTTLRGEGLTLSLPAGWHGLVGGGVVQAADVPLPPRARLSEGLVQVRRGHVHLMVSNGGPWVPYLPQFRPAGRPLVLTRADLLPGGMEGFSGNDTFARLDERLGGDMVDILADLGPKPDLGAALRKANAVLATLRVLRPHVLRPRNGMLAADGVSVRLLPGWSGHAEIPADHYAARLVVRAARGAVQLTLLEYAETELPHHLDLPITLTSRNVLHSRGSPPIARRVFSTGGRSFDISVTVPSPHDLQEANRLLRTLKVAPRPWTFRCCELSLHLPGTWHVALRPRLYPVLKLYGPRILVVLTELRPGERTGSRILRRAGRRFRFEVRPASARATADAVLATLRARPRT